MWRTATTTMSISDVVMLTMDHLIWTQDWPWFANLAFNKGESLQTDMQGCLTFYNTGSDDLLILGVEESE